MTHGISVVRYELKQIVSSIHFNTHTHIYIYLHIYIYIFIFTYIYILTAIDMACHGVIFLVS